MLSLAKLTLRLGCKNRFADAEPPALVGRYIQCRDATHRLWVTIMVLAAAGAAAVGKS